MARDHFVWWDDERPTREEVQLVCEDFVLGLGTVEWKPEDGRFHVLLAGASRSPVARILSKADYDRIYSGPKFEARCIEVFDGKEALDVITRQADNVTNAIAEGLAAVFARVWRGRLEQG